uniref:Gon-4 like b n=1 Tax=Cyclopterus lumpus TaxID=8103 RepID=A0A8C3AJF4_CYCLU
MVQVPDGAGLWSLMVQVPDGAGLWSLMVQVPDGAGLWSLMQMERRRPAQEDVCPLQSKSMRPDGEAVIRLERKSGTGSSSGARQEEEGTTVVSGDITRTREHTGPGVNKVGLNSPSEASEDELGRLDIDLDRKSRQLNLTSSNVRAILHEVITHEHVVAMMKAAIRETQDLPMFVSRPQFVDIDLEEDEDSSDEEYRPDEEEEEEEDTAEEVCGCLTSSVCFVSRETSCHCVCVCVCVCSLDRKADDDGNPEGSSCLAYRTRSKLRLVNVPLGQLEAALLAPDIPADMSGHSAAQRAEDRHWTKWLQGLMAPDSEEEADDDDDPEYNFLDDQDEPDLEDYRTDRAVQITKKEVNELLEELFDTVSLLDFNQLNREEEPGREETCCVSCCGGFPCDCFVLSASRSFEAPLADMLTERRRTVRKQYEALQQKRALQDTTNHHRDHVPKDSRVHPVFHLDYIQTLQLQQQIQQVGGQPVLSFWFWFWFCLGLAFPLLPADTAWLLATRPVFLYPELLPVCSLDPAIHPRHQRNVYTAGEDGLIVLGLKHFEGTFQSDQLISCYLLRKTQSNFRKHIREMSGPRAPPSNVIKTFLAQRVIPPLLTCSRVQLGDRRPPVDRSTANMPNWLKNSQLIIQKTRQTSACYPRSLPPGCTLRLHPHWLKKLAHPPPPPHRRLFNLAHNASLLPLARAPADKQPISFLSLPPPGVTLLSNTSAVSGALAPPPVFGPVPLAAVCTVPAHPVCADIIQSCLPIGRRMQQSVPVPSPVHPNTTNPIMPCSTGVVKPGYFLLQMVRTPKAPPTDNSQHALGQKIFKEEQNEKEQTSTKPHFPLEEVSSASTLSPEEEEEEEEDWTALGVARLNGGEEEEITDVGGSGEEEEITDVGGGGEEEEGTDVGGGGEEEEGTDVGGGGEEEEGTDVGGGGEGTDLGGGGEEEEGTDVGGGGEEEEGTDVGGGGDEEEGTDVGGGGDEEEGTDVGGGGEEEEGTDVGGGGEEEEGTDVGGGGEEEAGGEGGEGEQGGEENEGQMEDMGGGQRDEDGEKDEDQDRQGEDEEEEDFDDLTQDEDEEEVMSSASEESVLSVPELQETMKQLTWLAAERRLCADGDSEEDHSPTSPGSQEEEEEEEEEEEGPKGEMSGEARGREAGLDEEAPSGEGTPRGGGRCRGRGRSRPLRGLRRSRQERRSKDAAKLLLLYDDNILNNDPHRESKDVAFAQSYLSRVREALQDIPGQVEDFVSLLNDFEQVGDGQEVMSLFRKLHCILGDRTDLLRDFAAFLHPEQALQCGLFEEQQAFERSRRFLRQLEISFGDNPSHYQKIIKALQTGPDLSPTSIDELKAQMAALLKGHNHLQTEFWVFFDELRPPPVRPGQFEEAHWPDDAGGGSDGGEGFGHVSGGVASSGFEEVTLPELEEEENQPMTSRRRRMKMAPHRNYKDCDWSDKDWPCLCRDAKIRRHRRKGCSRCHGNKVCHHGVNERQVESTCPDSPRDEELDEEDEEERKTIEKKQSTTGKRSRKEEVMGDCSASSILYTPPSTTSSMTSSMIFTPSIFTSSSVTTSSTAPSCSSSAPPPDLTVCAKNISLTASGEKVILWTREADRVILTTCQQEGANQNTFQAVSTLLSNKTPSEVSHRFRDLMRLFRTAARQTGSDDEAPPTQPAAANKEEN